MNVDAPHRRVEYLVTGEFREGPGYTTWRTQGTDDWLLVYTLAGAGRFGYRDGVLPVTERDAVLLRPGTLHDYSVTVSPGHWHFLWSHFHPRPHWHGWMGWPEHAPGLMHLQIGEEAPHRIIRNRFRAADRLRVGMSSLAVDRALNALEDVLILLAESRVTPAQPALDPRVTRAMDYVLDHQDKPITLADLARAGGLSVSRLAHLFTAQLGITPQQFIEQRRMMRARELLRFTARPIKEIAYHLGYQNPFYFSLRFRKDSGDSPTEYRAKAMADPGV